MHSLVHGRIIELWYLISDVSSGFFWDSVGITVEGQEIESADSYQTVYDSGNPAHASEEKRHQVQIEETDQSPVDSSDNGDRQCRIS